MADTTDIDRLNPGDHLYEVTYYVVESIDENGRVVVARNTKNADTIKIDSGIVKNAIYTTNQFADEVKLTRTQLAQKIETLGHSSFRVTFKKQLASNDVADGLADADLGTQAKRRRVVKALMEGGERRVMHARLHRTEEFDAALELGRYRVIDLEALDKSGGNLKASTRLIDTRTCEELIVDNVRYYV